MSAVKVDSAQPRSRSSTNSQSSPRAPRRVVLLEGDEESGVKKVLADYPENQINGTHIRQDMQRFADENRGDCVAVEWQGPRSWIRFLWCRK